MPSTIFYININRLRALGVSENSPTPQIIKGVKFVDGIEVNRIAA